MYFQAVERPVRVWTINDPHGVELGTVEFRSNYFKLDLMLSSSTEIHKLPELIAHLLKEVD